jgi:hypothetical protein
MYQVIVGLRGFIEVVGEDISEGWEAIAGHRDLALGDVVFWEQFVCERDASIDTSDLSLVGVDVLLSSWSLVNYLDSCGGFYMLQEDECCGSLGVFEGSVGDPKGSAFD